MRWCQCRSGLQPDSLPGGLEPHVSGRSLNLVYSSACFPYAERQHGSVRLWRTLHATRTPVPAQVENPRPRDLDLIPCGCLGGRQSFKVFSRPGRKKGRSVRNAPFAQGKLRRFSRTFRKTPLPRSYASQRPNRKLLEIREIYPARTLPVLQFAGGSAGGIQLSIKRCRRRRWWAL